MKYLLDTNTCIDLLRGRDDVIGRLEQVAPDDCVLSIVSYFELLSGVERCADPDRERGKVDRLANTIHFLAFDRDAAEASACVRHQLEVRGERIGAYDTLIAGHALARQLIIVTDNVAEFARVDSLVVENWRSTSP